MKTAFTLIELLIVVAIIAILAAIAVPNFLEAQVRSKVSRVKADMRTIATGMEAYRVDYNRYPPHRMPDGVTAISPVVRCYIPLTTPVSYLSSIPQDPFFMGRRAADYATWGLPVFDYWSYNPPFKYGPKTGTYWLVESRGPDKIKNLVTATAPDGASFDYAIPYDPTNGTISAGDIVISNTGFLSLKGLYN
jgi:type II secretion system protein G